MNLLKASVAGLGLMTALAPAARAEELVIFQKWSSPAEVRALRVLQDAATERGIEWIDITIPHDTGSNVSLLNLVTGGQPPNIFSEKNPAVYRDLSEMGLGRSLSAEFEVAGVMPHLPEAVRRSITVDGEIRSFPLGLHIDGMLFYNTEVAERIGIDPNGWSTLDEMYADFPKIEAAGVVPLALGAQAWQVGYLTHSLVASLGGADLFNRIYGPEPELAALDDPAFAATFDWLRKFQQAADNGSSNRDWNMTTNMVINGDALMQIHGDWMKGEWRAAGKVAGEDFGCIKIPGAEALPVTVDGWGVLGGQSEAKDAAEIEFALMAVDPAINAEFAYEKGATPIRTDVPTDRLDICSIKTLEMLEDPAAQVQNPHSMTDADWQSAIWETAFNFWSDPSMTTEEAITELRDSFDVILY
ncbi:ABC transporter substrate-binding protein [Limimaricola sp. AA108-03]|uniref:ABC transporter substrate-binding protein n=1 Tax=Limimaricola sp. AA108-03 TaxID=3425945 RepID=UPI003D76B121